MKNKKSLGQHWLKNRAILDKIAGLAADGGAYDFSEKTGVETKKQKVSLCVEIGPGLGTLTSSLFKYFDKIIAVEYDEKLAENLPKSFPGKNLEVINEDILKYDFSTIEEKYVIAGNIPYYITSPIIEKVLTISNLPERVILLMQKEVAERILSEKETLLSLFVKNRAEVVAGPVVVKEEFTPPPKVDSQVVILIPHIPIVGGEVFKLIKMGFAAPRKKLTHNLAGLKPKAIVEGVLVTMGINPGARPGELKLEDWQSLYLQLKVE
ncbi:ribosomal RNA small subunit methyltransferase A [Candidatus Saccharibacteria bacterium]|nr:ribosomal RNA small subunit methyltransferase A [Candidatus Saccharibacteria bacterium]